MKALTGIWPASVTPMTEDGSVDLPSLARLLAYFEDAGCSGVVLGGTNGEGPSLSAVEKRDLVRTGCSLTKLPIVAGVATTSLTEATWLCEQARKAGALAALVMPPFYFREVDDASIQRWFWELLESTTCPIIAYNFPKRCGVVLTPELFSSLSKHERFMGAKDSSGESANLPAFAQAIPGRTLMVGDESLFWDALDSGWSGSISGVANVMPRWLSQIAKERAGGKTESAKTKFDLAVPSIKALRAIPQPAGHKAALKHLGIISNATMRLPLRNATPEEAQNEITRLL